VATFNAHALMHHQGSTNGGQHPRKKRQITALKEAESNKDSKPSAIKQGNRLKYQVRFYEILSPLESPQLSRKPNRNCTSRIIVFKQNST